jgi:hypothetical protein
MDSQKDAMDVLQAWVDEYNTEARPELGLKSGGEAGGAQLRIRYVRGDETVSILHMVAVEQDGRPVIRVQRFDGPLPDTAVEAGLWASRQLGRR